MVSKKGSKRGSAAARSGAKALTAKRLTAAQAAGVRGGKRADGTGGGNVAAGWNLINNKKNA